MAHDEPPAGRDSVDEPGTGRAAYDWNAISPSIAVIKTVATLTGNEPTRLESLYDAIDPDALDAVLEKMMDGEVSFTYAGHEVTVTSDGTVSLDEQPVDDISTEIAVSDDR